MSDQQRADHAGSCLRAGYVMLVASAFGLLLLSPLSQVRGLAAYTGYVTERIRLINALEQLEADRCFDDIASRPWAAESRDWTLDKLGRYMCIPPRTITTPRFFGSTQPELMGFRLRGFVTRGTADDGTPISRIAAYAPLRPMTDLLTFLRALSDPRLLSAARSVSGSANLSIYRWSMMRATLVMNRSLQSVTDVQVTNEADLPTITSEHIDAIFAGQLRLLTLDDVRKLASFEPVSVSDIDRENETVSSIAVPGTELKVSAFVAAQGTLATAWLALLWIWLNQAQLGARSPISEMFNRSIGSRVALKVLLCVPLFAMALLTLGLYGAGASGWAGAVYWVAVLTSVTMAKAIVTAITAPVAVARRRSGRRR